MNSYEAKRIPLSQILSQLGHNPHHETNGELWYVSPFREETKPSFKVNVERNIWYDFGEAKGGNVLDFVMRLYQVNMVGALCQLEQLSGQQPIFSPQPEMIHAQPEISALTVKKIQALTNPALITYLKKRGIPTQVARPYVQEMYYTYNQKPYFALAFPNVSKGYELRNPYYQGVYSKKDISYLAGKDKRTVALFEGFMDFLSALTYYEESHFPHDVIILNSVAMKEKALQWVQQQGVQQIMLYFDHDVPGQKTKQYFQEHLQDCNVIDHSNLYKGYNDFNEFLIATQT